MKTIKLISNTKEGWETDGEFNPPFLEVTNEEQENCFDIGKRDEINDLKSNCNLNFLFSYYSKLAFTSLTYCPVKCSRSTALLPLH